MNDVKLVSAILSTHQPTRLVAVVRWMRMTGCPLDAVPETYRPLFADLLGSMEAGGFDRISRTVRERLDHVRDWRDGF